ncbi:hypothetical protein J6590_018991 [Homalodisca vitripennis]|nr:hypothetical protein J6590_018991 [Homalodisca vitripennis]
MLSKNNKNRRAFQPSVCSVEYRSRLFREQITPKLDSWLPQMAYLLPILLSSESRSRRSLTAGYLRWFIYYLYYYPASVCGVEYRSSLFKEEITPELDNCVCSVEYRSSLFKEQITPKLDCWLSQMVYLLPILLSSECLQSRSRRSLTAGCLRWFIYYLYYYPASVCSVEYRSCLFREQITPGIDSWLSQMNLFREQVTPELDSWFSQIAYLLPILLSSDLFREQITPGIDSWLSDGLFITLWVGIDSWLSQMRVSAVLSIDRVSSRRVRGLTLVVSDASVCSVEYRSSLFKEQITPELDCWLSQMMVYFYLTIIQRVSAVLSIDRVSSRSRSRRSLTAGCLRWFIYYLYYYPASVCSVEYRSSLFKEQITPELDCWLSQMVYLLPILLSASVCSVEYRRVSSGSRSRRSLTAGCLRWFIYYLYYYPASVCSVEYRSSLFREQITPELDSWLSQIAYLLPILFLFREQITPGIDSWLSDGLFITYTIVERASAVLNITRIYSRSRSRRSLTAVSSRSRSRRSLTAGYLRWFIYYLYYYPASVCGVEYRSSLFKEEITPELDCWLSQMYRSSLFKEQITPELDCWLSQMVYLLPILLSSECLRRITPELDCWLSQMVYLLPYYYPASVCSEYRSVSSRSRSRRSLTAGCLRWFIYYLYYYPASVCSVEYRSSLFKEQITPELDCWLSQMYRSSLFKEQITPELDCWLSQMVYLLPILLSSECLQEQITPELDAGCLRWFIYYLYYYPASVCSVEYRSSLFKEQITPKLDCWLSQMRVSALLSIDRVSSRSRSRRSLTAGCLRWFIYYLYYYPASVCSVEYRSCLFREQITPGIDSWLSQMNLFREQVTPELDSWFSQIAYLLPILLSSDLFREQITPGIDSWLSDGLFITYTIVERASAVLNITRIYSRSRSRRSLTAVSSRSRSRRSLTAGYLRWFIYYLYYYPASVCGVEYRSSLFKEEITPELDSWLSQMRVSAVLSIDRVSSRSRSRRSLTAGYLRWFIYYLYYYPASVCSVEYRSSLFKEQITPELDCWLSQMRVSAVLSIDRVSSRSRSRRSLTAGCLRWFIYYLYYYPASVCSVELRSRLFREQITPGIDSWLSQMRVSAVLSIDRVSSGSRSRRGLTAGCQMAYLLLILVSLASVCNVGYRSCLFREQITPGIDSWLSQMRVSAVLSIDRDSSRRRSRRSLTAGCLRWFIYYLYYYPASVCSVEYRSSLFKEQITPELDCWLSQMRVFRVFSIGRVSSRSRSRRSLTAGYLRWFIYYLYYYPASVCGVEYLSSLFKEEITPELDSWLSQMRVSAVLSIDRVSSRSRSRRSLTAGCFRWFIYYLYYYPASVCSVEYRSSLFKEQITPKLDCWLSQMRVSAVLSIDRVSSRSRSRPSVCSVEYRSCLFREQITPGIDSWLSQMRVSAVLSIDRVSSGSRSRRGLTAGCQMAYLLLILASLASVCNVEYRSCLFREQITPGIDSWLSQMNLFKEQITPELDSWFSQMAYLLLILASLASVCNVENLSTCTFKSSPAYGGIQLTQTMSLHRA